MTPPKKFGKPAVAEARADTAGAAGSVLPACNLGVGEGAGKSLFVIGAISDFLAAIRTESEQLNLSALDEDPSFVFLKLRILECKRPVSTVCQINRR